MVAIFHRHVPGGYVGDHLGDEEWIVLRSVLFMHGIVSGFFLESVKATDTGSYDHTHAVFVDFLACLKTCIGYGFAGCNHCILSVEVELAELLAVEVVSAVEVLDFTGKLSLEFRSVEVSDGSGAADAFKGVVPCCSYVVTYGGDCAESGDYYSF